MRRLEISKIVIYLMLFVFTLMVLVPLLNLLALSLTDPGKAHLMGGLDIFRRDSQQSITNCYCPIP